jgi:hypothetical protein
VTAGKIVRIVVSRPDFRLEASPREHEEIQALRASVDEVGDRLRRLEEERDFYKALLEAPKTPGAPRDT